MKEFMMIFVGTSYEELGLSPEQMQARMGKWFAWSNKMESQGIAHRGEALHDAVKRISGPDRVVGDGPFVESKELVGGYYIVKAETVEDVVEIAQDFPDYDLGSSVEIREIMVFDQ
ncbi:MAG: YciI family protein [Flavobacteriales bacterium]|nr:YciI family protein [Flavobacteriales bacterium]